MRMASAGNDEASVLNPFTLFTLAGPVIGASALYLQLEWLFWIGVGIAAVNLALNVASGLMKLPVLPAVAVGIGAIALDERLVGAACGLLVYTAIEGFGELLPQRGAEP